jgi:hypothetical protein
MTDAGRSPSTMRSGIRRISSGFVLGIIVVVLLATAGWLIIVEPGLKERTAAREIEALGAYTDYRFDKTRSPRTHVPPGPAFFWKIVDYRLIFRVQRVSFYGTGRRHSHVTDDTLMPLLADLSDVHSISLGDTNITNRGLHSLSRLRNLRTLSLRETKLQDESLEALAPLRLQWLSLKRTWIGDIAIASLKGMTSLEHLSLERTRVSDRGLVHLEGLHNLKSLNLRRCKSTEDGVNELRRKLPKCEILWEPLNPPGTIGGR